jgi:hypothetical protein
MKGHLRAVAPRSGSPVPNILWSFPPTPVQDTISAPHRLPGLRIRTILDQSLDNIRVPIHGSPHQGRAVLLQDEHASRGCSWATLMTGQVSSAF